MRLFLCQKNQNLLTNRQLATLASSKKKKKKKVGEFFFLLMTSFIYLFSVIKSFINQENDYLF